MVMGLWAFKRTSLKGSTYVVSAKLCRGAHPLSLPLSLALSVPMSYHGSTWGVGQVAVPHGIARLHVPSISKVIAWLGHGFGMIAIVIVRVIAVVMRGGFVMMLQIYAIYNVKQQQ